ncbi:hypothetical protein VNO78_34932 [Psophocarpus tetragonolobus]|uniref:Uncharacterized protein n=1 Tax=Psophocarpus tetragonolobus TaxID=3891 RepID=A0AAN9NMW8_PSOTE
MRKQDVSLLCTCWKPETKSSNSTSYIWPSPTKDFSCSMLGNSEIRLSLNVTCLEYRLLLVTAPLSLVAGFVCKVSLVEVKEFMARDITKFQLDFPEKLLVLLDLCE